MNLFPWQSEKKYCLVKLSIFHLNKTFNQIWMKDYALSTVSKITNLILGHEIDNYFSVVKYCIKNKQMLFRARYKNSNNLFIEVNIWSNKKHFNKFFKNVKGAFVFNRLKKEGFQIDLTKKYVDDNFIRALIQKLKDNPNSKVDFNGLGL